MPFRVHLVRLVDWVAIKCAHYILVESDKQKKYFTETLGVDEKKCVTVYTGVDTRIFRIDPLVQKKPTFTVLFRGRIMSEAGVTTIIRSAKLLEDRGVHFLIIGHGCNQAMQEFNDVLREVAPKNVTHIDEQIPFLKLARLMQECHVSLGQFAHHDRLRRTIPHKAYESMALNIPYITARAAGASEVLVDKVTCLMVCPDDPQDLAEKIMMLFNNDELRSRLASNAYELCATRFMPSVVVKPLAQLIDMLP